MVDLTAQAGMGMVELLLEDVDDGELPDRLGGEHLVAGCRGDGEEFLVVGACVLQVALYRVGTIAPHFATARVTAEATVRRCSVGRSTAWMGAFC